MAYSEGFGVCSAPFAPDSLWLTKHISLAKQRIVVAILSNQPYNAQFYELNNSYWLATSKRWGS